MSKTIDERVLEMKFDNKQFESNVSTTMSTLDKLKHALNLKGASQGLENVNSAASKFNMSGMSNAIESVHAKFSALQVVGVTALANITNSAVDAGKKIASALTIDPIKDGFQEYETQINSVQTILANTQKEHTNVTQVNAALDELNKYADDTIYNFTEMTRNIGTFTAAGVKLKDSVSSIKGIANLAAVSGSTSQQASTAMYQLSQALAAGKVNLQDWNSVVNAGMGGQVFQDALIRTSEHLKTGAKEAIKTSGTFRESLTKSGWLTTEVLTETLNQISGAYSEADLIAQGYTKDQAKEIAELGKMATDAATKVKTFSQLIDTLKEALGSGWTESWRHIIGDFDDAKELWTEASNFLGGVINKSSEKRNDYLASNLDTGWDQFLSKGINDADEFTKTVTDVAKKHGVAVDDMVKKSGSFEKSLKKGWMTSDILKESVSKTADGIRNLSDKQLEAKGYTKDQAEELLKLDKSIKNGSLSVDEYVEKMNKLSGRENIIQAFKNAFEGLVSVIKPIKEAFTDIFPPLAGQELYDFTNKLVEFTSNLKISDETAGKIKSTFKGLFSVISIVGKVLLEVGKAFGKLLTSDGVASFVNLLLSITGAVGDFISSLSESFDSGGLSAMLSTVVDGISNVLKTAFDGISNFGSLLPNVGDGIVNVVSGIWDAIKNAFSWITDNFSIGDLFAGLAGGGIFVAAKKFMGLIDTVKDKIESLFGGDNDGGGLKKIAESFSDILGSVHDSLQAFTTGIKVTSILMIAIAIGILSASLKTISGLKVEDIGKSLLAMAGMFAMLSLSFKSITKTLSGFDGKGLIKAGVSILIMALAIKTLASAMVKLSGLSWGEIARGLVSIGVGLTALCLGLKAINKVEIKLSTSVAILALAESCKILADALAKFGGMSLKEIAKGLIGMGGALAILVIALKGLDKIGGIKSIFSSTGLLIAVQSLSKMADGLKKFGSMSWDEIKRGLVGMGGALAELSVAVGALGKIAGFSGIIGSGAILIVVQGLADLVDAFKEFGSMSWDEIKRGLVGMGGALGEVALVSGVLGKLAGFSGIIGSGAILLLIQGLGDLADAFIVFGVMSWDEILRGLAGMGGALAEVAIVSGALGKLAGFSGLLGSGAILLLIQGLGDLATALLIFGSMSWDEIKQGLVGMGGALAEVAIVSGALGKLGGLSSLLGAGSLVLAVQSLGDLADAFIVFGSMTWDEIKQGLVGMGGALAEVAVITGLLGKLGGLSGLLGGGSLLLAVQSLGDLSNAFKNFGSMSWDEVKQGLVGMGGALTELAVISGLFGSLGGLSGLLGGASLLLAVQSLGDLADAFKKFGEMSWDEIGRGLAAMGAALGEIALGSLANTLSALGGMSLGVVAEPLGQLADAVKKWSGVTVPEDLGRQLSILAEGVSAFTFDGFGASTISTVAEPLGTLADSVRKWSGVSVPEGLGEQLEALSKGVGKFTFGGLGGSTISTVAEPLGTLADSIKKWSGVTVPEGLENGLESIARGVQSFSLAFVGGWTLGGVTGPLGDLADSIKKWSGVTVPEGLEEGMKSISRGVLSFSLAFAGGWTLGGVTGPLGDLADSVKKWNGVSVPEGLEEGLKSISRGVLAFSLAFVGGWTLGGVTGPLGDLADSVKKWNGVTVPEGLETQLENLAKGVKSFVGIDDISSTVNNIASIASSMTTLSGVGFDAVSQGLGTVATAFTDFASSTGSLSGVGETIVTNVVVPIQNAGPQVSGAVTSMLNDATSSLSGCASQFNAAGQQAVTGFVSAFSSAESSVTSAVSSMMSSVSSTVSSSTSCFSSISSAASTAMSSVNSSLSSIGSGAASFRSAISGLSGSMRSAMNSVIGVVTSASGRISSAVSTMMSGFSNSIRSQGDSAANAFKAVITKMTSSITGQSATFMSAGQMLMTKFNSGLKAGSSGIASAIKSALSKCVSSIKGFQSSFAGAGKDLGQGLINGIKSKEGAAYSAGYALGKKAVQGEKDGQKSHSPSKLTIKAGKWLGEGLVIGMNRMGKSVYKAGKSMGSSAVSSISDALVSTQNMISNIDDVQPTISPVLDMSNVNGVIDQGLAIGTTMNLNSISASMRRRAQNATNTDVVSAIDKLRSEVRDLEKPSYNINGITYDNGSQISEAIETLVRAAIVERRV